MQSAYKKSIKKWYMRKGSLTEYRGRGNYVRALQNPASYTYGAVEILIIFAVGLVAIPWDVISA